MPSRESTAPGGPADIAPAEVAPLAPVAGTTSELGECPLWHAASRSLFWVDITGRAIRRLDTRTGAVRHWAMPEEPGCIGLVADDAGDAAPDRLVVALRSGFHLLGLDGDDLSRLTGPLFDTSRFRFNDGAVDPAGRFWAGSVYEPKDSASAGLYCLERGTARAMTGPDAPSAPHRDWGVRTSNGLAFAPDGRTLYHADTPAHTVWACDFDPRTGSIGRRRVFWRAAPDRGAPDYGGRPDGAAVDAQGCYWSAQYEGGRIVRLSPAGEVVQSVPVPARCPTMVAFGGPDLSTLYVTTARGGRTAQELARWPDSGCVFAARTSVAGLPAHAYRP
jgi:sugar lactone lactonase YvrE